MASKKNVLARLEKIGLSEKVQEVPYLTDEPKIPYFLSFPNENAKKRYDSDNSFGQGFHPKDKEASIKSVAEFLERLCLDNPSNENLLSSKFNENNMVDPGLFCCYSDEQVKNRELFKEKSREGSYLWYPTEEIISRDRVLIPAQLIFLNSAYDEEFPIRNERISTGAAFGVSRKNALENGLLEAIERDSCISSYLLQRDLKKINGFPEKINELIEYLKRYNLETHVLDATSDLGVPTTMAISVDRTGLGPAIEVGSSSRFNYEDSIYKSILESIQCRRSARIFKNQFSDSIDESNIFSLDDRFAFWHSLDRINDLDFWIEGESFVDYSNLKSNTSNLNLLLKRFEDMNYHVFVADIAIPEIKNEGFEVLKVSVPELHPLYLDERAKSLYSVHYGSIKDNPQLKPHPLT